MTNHSKWTVGALSLVTAMAAAASPADAARFSDRPERDYDRQSSMQGEQQSHRYQGQHQDQRKISGTVQRSKTIGLRGSDEENLIVKLETRDGRTKIVDLGNAEHIEDLDIQRGDRITVWGRSATVGNQRIFLADKVRANDQTMNIERNQMTRYEEDVHDRIAQSDSFFESWFD